MDKEKIGKGIVKGSKWLMIILWTVVLILLLILIKRNITLSAESLRKDVAKTFKTNDFSVVHLDERVNITISTRKDTKDIVPQVRDFYRKTTKYKLNDNVDTMLLIIGDMYDKPIMYSEMELEDLKKIEWNKLTRYEDAIKELNIKLQ